MTIAGYLRPPPGGDGMNGLLCVVLGVVVVVVEAASPR
jgi:hypothetical protein